MDAEPRLSKELQQAQEAVMLAKTQLNRVLAGAKLGEILIQETFSSRIEEAEANLNRVSEVRPVDVAVAEAELKQAEAQRRSRSDV